MKNTSNIAFLCETSVKPSEIQHIKGTLKDQGLWFHLKSSIDLEIVLVGRPHGVLDLYVSQCKKLCISLLI